LNVSTVPSGEGQGGAFILRPWQRFLSKEELGRLGEVLAGQRMAYPVPVAAILMILFTGCRVSEILELRWQDVRGQPLRLRDSNTGPRTVWIGEEGRAVLDSLTRRRGIERVFHDPKVHTRAIRLTYFWHRIRELAELPNVRIHDLRHTYASHAAAQSETLPMIARLLGHRRVMLIWMIGMWFGRSRWWGRRWKGLFADNPHQIRCTFI
jgi:integrase